MLQMYVMPTGISQTDDEKNRADEVSVDMKTIYMHYTILIMAATAKKVISKAHPWSVSIHSSGG